MVADYNHLAALTFVDSLREGDRDAAMIAARAVTADPDAVNYGVMPDKEYNESDLADLIELNLQGIEQGRWDMTSKVYLPAVIGAICHWIAAEADREDDGKTSSESFEQSTTINPSGA